MATLAMLDKRGVLTGYESCAGKAWKTRKGQVAVPDGCDLAPGRYRWDGKTFLPLAPDGSQDRLEQEPDAIRAIALGFVKLSETVELPEATLLWLESYTRTRDGQGIKHFTRPKR